MLGVGLWIKLGGGVGLHPEEALDRDTLPWLRALKTVSACSSRIMRHALRLLQLYQQSAAGFAGSARSCAASEQDRRLGAGNKYLYLRQAETGTSKKGTLLRSRDSSEEEERPKETDLGERERMTTSSVAATRLARCACGSARQQGQLQPRETQQQGTLRAYVRGFAAEQPWFSADHA
eukprot:364219-Chlamydomonas_euryale.AAC.6